MPNTIASYLSSVPPTSELYAPSQVQIPSDFPSTATSESTDSTFPSSGYEGVDWDRLLGYQPPNGALKRGRSSWIYSWGWRIIKRNNNEAYWLCRLCHHGRGAPRPTSHIYKANATNGAMYHLKAVHRVSEDGQLPVDDGTQSTLETFANPRPRDFNSFVFRSMILRLFTTRQLPLSLIEDEAFRALLVYLEPRLEKSIPSRRSLGRYIAKAYDASQSKVEQSLLGAITKINVAFDIWTSPGRRFSLLGVVGHYLDHQQRPCNVLLGLPRLRGSHTAVNIAATMIKLLDRFELKSRIGNFITDNANENGATLAELTTKHAINTKQCHVLCMGHVINLVAQQILFGNDVDAFEPELVISVEQLELQQWRRIGPIGKLHNLIKYITHSSNRRERFHEIQRDQPQPLRNQDDRAKESYDLIKDNRTRWNSWFDAAERALALKQSIDDFVDQELEEYTVQMAMFKSRGARGARGGTEPKQPSIFDDRLTSEDWSIIAQYTQVLRPLKLGTMLLQGHVKDVKTSSKVVTGGLWIVLPIFEEILSSFEVARKRHPTAAKQRSQLSQSTPPNTSPPSSPPPPLATRSQRTTRSSQIHPQGPSAASQIEDTVPDDAVLEKEQSTNPTGEDNDPSAYTDLQSHFSTNFNLGWQKFDKYYRLTDDTPIYRAAVVLHPRMKWGWFNRHWGQHHKDWVTKAKSAVQKLWFTYKPTTTATDTTPAVPLRYDSDDDELPTDKVLDEYDQYCAEGIPSSDYMTRHDSPIPYWLSKRTVWPNLSQMALDLYSTPPCSDEPERVFSIGGNTLNPRRRVMTEEMLNKLLCLRSWYRCGIIDFETLSIFEQAVQATYHSPIADELAYNYTSNNSNQGSDDDQ
jgi:hypothetical protein